MKVRIPNSGGPGNMNQMLKQAQKMQEDMAALQNDLEQREDVYKRQTSDNGRGYSLLITPSLYHKSGAVEVYDII